MRFWRMLRGGHWERWWVDAPVNSRVWHHVGVCTYAPPTLAEACPTPHPSMSEHGEYPPITSKTFTRPRPSALCRGTAECEDYLTWPERLDVLRGRLGRTRPYDEVRASLGLEEWRCHFCGSMRSNDEIAVASTMRHLRGIGWTQVPVKMTACYCRDRAACRDAAVRWTNSVVLPGSLEASSECP